MAPRIVLPLLVNSSVNNNSSQQNHSIQTFIKDNTHSKTFTMITHGKKKYHSIVLQTMYYSSIDHPHNEMIKSLCHDKKLAVDPVNYMSLFWAATSHY